MLGAMAAFGVLKYLGPKSLFPDSDLSLLFIGTYLGGYFGARSFSMAIDQNLKLSELLPELFSLGPMTFYGGAIGSTIVALILASIRKWQIKDLIDIGFPAGLLGLSIGRIGCFFNGDDYGIETVIQGEYAPWFSVVFPNLQDELSRHPVQLYSTISVGILAISVIVFFDKIRGRYGRGVVGISAVSIYAVLRFCLEYYRGDPRGSVFDGLLSTSQFISVIVLAACCFLLGKYFVKQDQ